MLDGAIVCVSVAAVLVGWNDSQLQQRNCVKILADCLTGLVWVATGAYLLSVVR